MRREEYDSKQAKLRNEIDCCASDSAEHLINYILGRKAGLAHLHFCRKLSARDQPFHYMYKEFRIDCTCTLDGATIQKDWQASDSKEGARGYARTQIYTPDHRM
jgi:hypothetical protein